MMGKYRKVFARLAWLTTAVFVIAVLLPSVAKLLFMQYDSKGAFIGLLMKDESGQQHVGYVNMAYIFMPGSGEIVGYGYQAPSGTDLSKWHNAPSQAKEIDGFKWSDKGFLWSDHDTLGKVTPIEGTRLGLDRAVSKTEQTELTLPGAPWDIYGPSLSYLGRYPNYAIKFDNDSFKFDLMLSATVPSWYMYNRGEPFRAGDFSKVAMNELIGTVSGTIIHNKTGKTFHVSGDGLMEASIGMPWNSTLSWGVHDWLELHFPGGWGGSLWKAHDDWQWGYHPDPHIGWLWDPELKKYHHFNRVDIINIDEVTDEVGDTTYPKRALWRAIGEEATLEVESTNVSFIPRLTKVAPWLRIAYGNNATKGRLIRRDGTVVDLGTGTGFMERYSTVVPDYVFWGPLMLILLVLTWSGYAAAIRSEAGRSMVPPAAWCAVGLFCIWVLNLAWS